MLMSYIYIYGEGHNSSTYMSEIRLLYDDLKLQQQAGMELLACRWVMASPLTLNEEVQMVVCCFDQHTHNVMHAY